MKSLALDSSGDLKLEHGSFQLVDGKELLRQKIQEVINTNKGEWFFDWEQGIKFSNILGKGVNEDVVRAEIEAGLQQVDDSLVISDFSMTTNGRVLSVEFKATNETTNTAISISTEY